MSPDDGTTAAGAAARQQPQPLPSDPAQIEALIARRREELASTIDQLVVRTHPKEIARRSAADARTRARDFAYTSDGQLRIERVAAVAAAGLALLTLLVLSRRRGRG
jgi:adenylate kinase